LLLDKMVQWFIRQSAGKRATPTIVAVPPEQSDDETQFYRECHGELEIGGEYTGSQPIRIEAGHNQAMTIETAPATVEHCVGYARHIASQSSTALRIQANKLKMLLIS
jgi:hypothetical protein